MNLEACIRELERYLSDRQGDAICVEHPRIVFVSHPSQVQRLWQEYENRPSLQVKTPRNYTQNGICDYLSYQDEMRKLGNNKHIVFGVCTWMSLYGKDSVKKEINSLFRISGGEGFRLVVICYGVQDLYRGLSGRDREFAIQVDAPDATDAITLSLPLLRFMNPMLPIPEHVHFVESLPEMPMYVETHADVEVLYVKTEVDAAVYPHCKGIEMVKSAYDVLKVMDAVPHMQQDWGTDSQWTKALELWQNYKDWDKLFREELDYDSRHPEDLFARNWSELSDNKRWLYLIALKSCEGTHYPVLTNAAQKTETPQELPVAIYEGILDVDSADPGFMEHYHARRRLLEALPESLRDSSSFVGLVWSKGPNAIKYLTDLTDMERYAVLQYCTRYGKEFTSAELMELLRPVYPALAAYLSPIDFSSALSEDGRQYLTRYFEEYRRCKLCNQITPEMLQMVEEQASSRMYNVWLPPSCGAARKMFNGPNGTSVVFVDAMGCEFAGFISSWARRHQLSVSVLIGRASIPTITSCNKENILSVFEACQPECNQELDKTKHGGENGNGANQVFTGYMIREIEILDKCLQQAARVLKDASNPVKRVVLVSDHGASRLAVIYGGSREKLVACDAGGTHGGRMVVGTADVSAFGEQMVKSDDGKFYSIASYDFIKGGRRPSVETHGGATLEEVCVPIVALSLPKIRHCVQVMNSPIRFNRLRRNETCLALFITPIVNEPVTMELDGVATRYNADTTDGMNYTVRLPDLDKPGTYRASVYAGLELIAQNLAFEAISAAGGVKKLFP